MLKYQNLEKSVEGKWGFWINFDLEEDGHFLILKNEKICRWLSLKMNAYFVLMNENSISMKYTS